MADNFLMWAGTASTEIERKDLGYGAHLHGFFDHSVPIRCHPLVEGSHPEAMLSSAPD